MRTFRRLSLPRVMISLVTAALLLLSSISAFAVTITSPAPNAKVSGVIYVKASTNPNEQYSYAVLMVDNAQLSLSNAQPVRFELDTRDLPDGMHVVQVSLADFAGPLSVSKPIKIFVANKVVMAKPVAPQPAPSQPKVTAQPTPTQPATPAKPVVEKPKPTVPTRTVVEKPKPAAPTKPVAAQPGPAKVVKPAPVALAPAVPAPAKSAVPRPVRGAELTIVLDGKPLFMTVTPVIQDGRTMVVLRPLVESTGGTVDWDAASKQALAMVSGKLYVFTIGESVLKVGDATQPIDRPAALADNRTIVPVTVWQQLFGGTVRYNPEFNCVTLVSPPKEMPGAHIAAVQ